MTCDEFKVTTQSEPEDTTRAQRAAAMNHAFSCGPCFEWFLSPARRLTKATAEDADRDLEKDLLDPEFRFTVGLPPLPG